MSKLSHKGLYTPASPQSCGFESSVSLKTTSLCLRESIGENLSTTRISQIEQDALDKIVRGLRNDPVLRRMYRGMTGGAEPPELVQSSLELAREGLDSNRTGRERRAKNC